MLSLRPSPTNNKIVTFVWWRNRQQSELWWLTAHQRNTVGFNHNALQQKWLVTCSLKFWPWICGLRLVKYAGVATWSAGLQLQPDIVLIRTGEADTHAVLKGQVSSDRGGAIFHVSRLSRRSQFQSRPWLWLTNKYTPIFPFLRSQCALCSGSAHLQGSGLLHAPIYGETRTRMAQRRVWWVTGPGKRDNNMCCRDCWKDMKE